MNNRRSVFTTLLVVAMTAAGGIALAYALACIYVGEWVAPGRDMLPVLARYPLLGVTAAGVVMASAWLWMYLRRGSAC
jgi:hypothetical protein